MKLLNNGEYAVCCPFPHTDNKGNTYYESRASAHINPEKNVYHCKVCGASHSEASFLAKVQGISYGKAVRLLQELEEKGEKSGSWDVFVDNLRNSETMMNLLRNLGIEDMIDELELGYRGDGIAFPVRVFGDILDVRTYDPEGNPKVKSEPGAYPLILPYDLWRNDDRPTLLCAGEKDMAIARKMGFNAITFTGGEMSFPTLFKHSFKGKTVYIAYDNDATGQRGSRKAATELTEAGAVVHIVDLSTVCVEEGEDIHDFFMKYKKSAKDLQDLMDNAPLFTQEEFEEARNEVYPLVRISEAFNTKYVNQTISSRVTILAKDEQPMEVPEVVELVKYKVTDKCRFPEGTTWVYTLDDENIKDILMMCDKGVKRKDVIAFIKSAVGIPDKEPFIRVKIKSSQAIYKAVVTDDMESEVLRNERPPAELTVYSLFPLESGRKYRIFYKRFPHPLQNQNIVGIVTNLEESDTSVRKFKVNDGVLESLKCFQAEKGKLNEKMDELAERVKAIAGPETMKELAWMVDLFYHTPLEFMFGDRKERGYLDMMIVGEPRSGKSQTTQALLNTYELGTIVSLKTASRAGLIGGSEQTSSGYRSRLGIIPRNHEGAIIFEEFSGGGKYIIRELTEIRSSNMVRIDKVNGSTRVPAMVRMLSISNTATGKEGNSIPIRQYPNGIKILLDLIGASEDIARYDLFLLIDKPKTYVSPTTKIDLEAFPKESYKNRVRWIWSRKPEQVRINRQVQEFIVECANNLNKKYDSHLQFFGAEAWKKLSRVAIATAAMVCSIDETGENLVVTEEHVQWAMKFMISCYDNEIFKLRQYVEEQRKYATCNEQAVQALQGIYNTNPTLVEQLEMSTSMTLAHLRSISGLSNDDFNKLVNRLAECYFIHYGEKIIPSERFRLAASRINRDAYVKGVGGL